MILSYPLVNEDGSIVPNAEITFCFKDMMAIQHKTTWIRTDIGHERYEIQEGCVSIYLRNRHEIDVKADYNELKALMTSFNSWDETP